MTVGTATFDLNCDMGESLGNWVMGSDEEIMPFVTTANVACGFHGGDPVTMAKTVALAKQHDVAVGSHPGYLDLLGFGRRLMQLSPEDTAAYITYQTGALRAFLDAEGLSLHHIKAHGAFFAFLRDEPAVAEAAAKSIAAFGDILLYWPAPAEGVAFCDAVAAEGIEIVEEIYPDLTYAPDGKLVIERHKKAADPEFAASQVRQFLEDGTVMANDGSTRVAFPNARSACVHGDAANAVAVAQAVGDAARAAGRELAAVMP
jgi:5-oxoprolinase (ATP-hydrolysing) subunit A